MKEKAINVLALVTALLAPQVLAEPKLFFVHNDHLGTPVAVTDEDQDVVWRTQKTPFGESSTRGIIEDNTRFPGQVFDEETGLSYNYFRDYDPSLGRYIQSDPIGLYGGLNTYAYVGGNPVNAIDPTGEIAWFLVPLVGGAVGGVIDLGAQLLLNGGNFDCVNWGQVAASATIGAALSSTGPGGFLFGRSANSAGKLSRLYSYPPRPGVLNRGNTRVGWSFNKNTGQQHFSLHGGQPRTPSHWHRDSRVALPAGDHNLTFAGAGGLAGHGVGAGVSGDNNCECSR